jgi:purine-binding chemotaxis protein CheW
MNFATKVDAGQICKVHTNRYLRQKYTKTKSMAILTFLLAEQEYGIDLIKIQETRRYEPVTKIANLPKFFKGVVKLRGKIVPVVDLRLRFKLRDVEYNNKTELIVLKLDSRIIAIIVDAIQDILITKDDFFSPVPARISDINSKYLFGLGSAKDRKVILVDAEKLMADKELMSVNELTTLNTLITWAEEVSV